VAYVERTKQPDELLARLAEIAREIEQAAPWLADDLVAEQRRLLAELRAQGIGR
jgi:hypothetical protein